jgi:hypothetical protein
MLEMGLEIAEDLSAWQPSISRFCDSKNSNSLGGSSLRFHPRSLHRLETVPFLRIGANRYAVSRRFSCQCFRGVHPKGP